MSVNPTSNRIDFWKPAGRLPLQHWSANSIFLCKDYRILSWSRDLLMWIFLSVHRSCLWTWSPCNRSYKAWPAPSRLRRQESWRTPTGQWWNILESCEEIYKQNKTSINKLVRLGEDMSLHVMKLVPLYESILETGWHWQMDITTGRNRTEQEPCLHDAAEIWLQPTPGSKLFSKQHVNTHPVASVSRW